MPPLESTDVATPQAQSPPSWHLLPAVLAAVFGLIGLVGAFQVGSLWQELLAKLDWYETEDSPLASGVMVSLTLPVTLFALAACWRLARAAVRRAGPSTGEPGPRTVWGIRLLGLPLLYPAVCVAWILLAGPPHAGPDSPTPEDRAWSLGTLAFYAAITLAIGLFGWIAPKPTFRLWFRSTALIVVAATIAYLGFLGVVFARAQSPLMGLAMSAGMLLPLLVACAIVLAMTRPVTTRPAGPLTRVARAIPSAWLRGLGGALALVSLALLVSAGRDMWPHLENMMAHSPSVLAAHLDAVVDTLLVGVYVSVPGLVVGGIAAAMLARARRS